MTNPDGSKQGSDEKEDPRLYNQKYAAALRLQTTLVIGF